MQNDGKYAWIERLKKRWGINSTFQIFIILIVFACTGFTVLYVEELIFLMLGIPEDKNWWLAAFLFIFITLPLYNAILLIYGFVFGQLKFFWMFENRFFRTIIFWKRKKNIANIKPN